MVNLYSKSGRGELGKWGMSKEERQIISLVDIIIKAGKVAKIAWR